LGGARASFQLAYLIGDERDRSYGNNLEKGASVIAVEQIVGEIHRMSAIANA
jgi:hypothetical protein